MTAPRFTEKQGQYLAFIYMYALVNGQAPAEADMQRFFGVCPPSVHRMVVELEDRGLIRRVSRQPRSIEVTLPPEDYPCSNRSKPRGPGTSSSPQRF